MSSLDQAWGTYGVLWPVVNQQLGVDPQIGNGLLEVLPDVPGRPVVGERDQHQGRNGLG